MRQPFKRLSVAAAIAALCIIGGSNWFEPLSALLLAQAQPQGESMPGPIIVDPPGPYRGHFRVPARKDLTRPTEFLSTFIVTYNGFSPQAQAAFQAAVDVWATQIQSSVPIRVTANWEPLDPGVLGSAGATTIHRNFSGAPVGNVWFPQATANKIAGTDLNPVDDDIAASFNSNFTWYYGTDGNAASNFDLMTVVLHELGHGLGFFGSMDGSGGIGTWGVLGSPFIYDLFAINGSSQSLLNTTLFPNGSAALAAQLVGNSVFFAGPNVGIANGGFAARLYAPNPWQEGSSYSHFNETTFPAGNINSLMTPQLGPGEAIHDTGPITRGLFTDTGWGAVTSCSYALSSASLNIPSGGGTGSVNVITTAGCAWTAVSNAPFITIDSGSGSGTGSGTVNFTVAANSSASRSGTLTIASQIFTVNQAAGLRRTGDYDGDGKADITVFRPSTGVWHMVPSGSSAPTAFAWGNGADRPVSGDFDGDGKTDIAVFRPSNGTWYIVPSTGAAPSGFAWGNGADVTVPGDYDGDGKTDIAVFRPSNGTWYVRAVNGGGAVRASRGGMGPISPCPAIMTATGKQTLRCSGRRTAPGMWCRQPARRRTGSRGATARIARSRPTMTATERPISRCSGRRTGRGSSCRRRRACRTASRGGTARTSPCPRTTTATGRPISRCSARRAGCGSSCRPRVQRRMGSRGATAPTFRSSGSRKCARLRRRDRRHESSIFPSALSSRPSTNECRLRDGGARRLE